jgi:hypothetical protein
MEITEVITGNKKKVEITTLGKDDIKRLPKTRLKPHFITKYGMEDAGRQIFLADMALLKLINDYNI